MGDRPHFSTLLENFMLQHLFIYFCIKAQQFNASRYEPLLF